MEYPVTLMVPEPIYRQAEAMANVDRKTIAEVLLAQLLETAQPVLHVADDSEQETMLYEVAAYKVMHAELAARYLGQWVAIHKGQLVDQDWDENALMQRRLRNYGTDIVLIRQVEKEADRELYNPSFRLEAR